MDKIDTQRIGKIVGRFIDNPRSYLRPTFLNPFFLVRKITLYFESRILPIFFKDTKPGTLFNLDLHIAVVQEIDMALSTTRLEMRSWNMSLHNHLSRKWYKFPDPVKYISAKNWRAMDPKNIAKFQKYYKRMLSRYAGFVVSYPPAFVELFLETKKPILLICPTRYEIPYTSDTKKWEKLNMTLIEGIESGQITMCVNSLAEQKYFEYYTGVQVDVIPTVCDYLESSWVGGGLTPVYFSKSSHFSKVLEETTENTWVKAEKLLGQDYSFEDLMKVPAIFVLPYNNNTMRMFEFAYAGIPVFVPSQSFLKNLYADGKEPGVLSEISNFRVFNISTEGLDPDDPSNYNSDTFIDYWIENSDFYNSEVMPNTYFIDSFSELKDFSERINRKVLKDATRLRNSRMVERRFEFYQKFEKKVL